MVIKYIQKFKYSFLYKVRPSINDNHIKIIWSGKFNQFQAKCPLGALFIEN